MFSWLSFNCANYICLNDWRHGLWVRHTWSFCSEVVYCPRFCKMNYVQVLFLAPFLFKPSFKLFKLHKSFTCSQSRLAPCSQTLTFPHAVVPLHYPRCQWDTTNISVLTLLRSITWTWCLLSILPFCYKREGQSDCINKWKTFPFTVIWVIKGEQNV